LDVRHVHNCQQTVEGTTANMGTKNLSSSIAVLPPELMRGVISFAVGPHEHDTIFRLSRVSQSFRQTVLDMSWLFTDASWNCWPTPLLDLWCRRARAQPLTVFLAAMTIDRLTVGEAPELKALLELCSRRWGTLTFVTISDERCIGFLERLLQCACPLLHTIRIMGEAGFGTTLHLHPDYLPSLQTLLLGRIWPIFSTSPTSVTELTFDTICSEDWSPLLNTVKSCHLIQKLTIHSWRYSGDNLISFPAITGKVALSSLTHLEIDGMEVNLAPAISQFLSHCDIPKLKSLNVRDQYFEMPGAFESLCQSVVRR